MLSTMMGSTSGDSTDDGLRYSSKPGIHQHAVFPDHLFGERLAHAHPDRADDLAFDRNRVQRAPAIVRRPDFVNGDFAGLFVDADFGHLRGIGIRGRRPDAGAFVLAAASFERRSVGTGAGQRAVEIDGSDHRFFEGHRVLRAFVFALLLQRSAKDLAFDAARDTVAAEPCSAGRPTASVPT